MPNWCWNSLHITGTKENVSRFVEAVEGEKTALDLNKILPSPKELNNIGVQGIVDGGPREYRTVDSKQVFLTKEELEDLTKKFLTKEELEDLTKKFLTKEELEDLTKKFGATNWYDWALTNWGTKWNIDDASVNVCGEGASFNFDSAWSPPISAIDKAAELYPELEFSMEFEEDGECFRGTATWSKGEQTSYNCEDYDPDEEDYEPLGLFSSLEKS